MEISKVEIPADNKPVVTFKIVDGRGNAVAPNDLDANSVQFGIAKIVTDKDTGLSDYESYLTNDAVAGREYRFQNAATKPTLTTTKQAQVDSGGKLTQTDTGYTYVFSRTIPATYDKAATTVVAGQATRNAREFVANSAYWFVPGGGTPVKREVVNTKTCNGCHDNIAAHGGQRREVVYCAVCHTDQTFDPESGNSVDLKVMTHKIHFGKQLPSVVAGKKPYYIVGYNLNVFDFSKAGFPQDVRNCTTCHRDAPQADNWKTMPSRAACGSCHDDIDWETGKSKFPGGKDHAAGPQKDDKACKTCHPADSGNEFDASVVGAHVIPTRSKQLKGLVYTLDSVTAKVGEKPVIEFTVKDNAGAALDATKLDFIEVVLAGPTTDYARSIREMVNQITVPPAAPFVRAGTLADLGGGKFRYTFAATLDATWKGSVGVGIAAYKNTTIKGNDAKDVVVREGNVNPVKYVSVDGSPVVPRRTVTNLAKCNMCHLELGSPNGLTVHGGIRRSPEYCDLCHHANATDEAARPKEKLPPESIHQKYMIHSLHIGNERDVAVEFYGRSVARTEDLGYPTASGQRNCSKCHLGTTNQLPLPTTALATTVTQSGQVIRTWQPVTATCIGCHSNQVKVAHFQLTTGANGVETCSICHGPGRDFAVDKVHRVSQ
jgi:OmcA/MtrC family decaheme c-type cytochrome